MNSTFSAMVHQISSIAFVTLTVRTLWMGAKRANNGQPWTNASRIFNMHKACWMSNRLPYWSSYGMRFQSNANCLWWILNNRSFWLPQWSVRWYSRCASSVWSLAVLYDAFGRREGKCCLKIKLNFIFKNGFSRSNLLRRISKKPIRTDAEASLMGHSQNKFDAKKIWKKNHT